MRPGISALLISLCAAPVSAEAPRLALPIDCILGETCFIEDYVDADPGPGQSDFTCGLKSRDGHRGTDIALLDFDAMEAGVAVLAAAPGTVDATRDGFADTPYTPEIATEMQGRECGNAVRIDHGGGTQTLYCHLKRGSITVRSGDEVQTGDPLAEVGLSGQTNYPHVHLSVIRDGQVIDPFAPNAQGTCGETGETLWLNPPPYHRTGLFTAGFSTSVPSFDAVRDGSARARGATPNDPLVAYARTFYAEAGDLMAFRADGPDGLIFQEDIQIDKTQADIFRAFGKRAPAGGWPQGAYRAYVTLTRGGEVLAVRHADITVE